MGLGSWPVWTLIAVVQLWWTPPSLPIPNYILLSRPNANIQPLHRTRLFPIHSPPSVPLILGKPLFEMCWFYGHCPPPSLSAGPTWKKSAPNHLSKPLHPWPYVGKKCSKPYWQAFHTHTPFRAMPIWKKHISKRGFPYFVWYCEKASVAEEPLISYSSYFCLPDCAFLSFCFCLPAATVLLFSLFLSLYRCVDIHHI